MILTCPQCGTQYVVKDGAIPEQGRQVRCAACKHSWHQDPEPAPVPEPEAEAPAEESLAEATLIEPRSGPEAEERAFEATAMAAETGNEAITAGSAARTQAAAQAEDFGQQRDEPVPPAPPPQSEPPPEPAPPPVDSGPGGPEPAVVADWDAPPGPEAQSDEFSPFAEREDEEEPRRRSPIVTLLVFALIIAAIAAAFWFLAPAEWKARVGLASAGTSPLALVTTHMDRQKLESGNELLTVTGRVINPTTSDQAVPPLQASLKTRTGKVVYRWTIAPPARTLPPGASAAFNSTEVDVPPGGDELTITLGSGQA